MSCMRNGKGQAAKAKLLQGIKHEMYVEHSDDSILSWKGQVFDQGKWKEMHLKQQYNFRQ